MMRISTKSGRVIAALTAVVFLMTSFLTVFADVTVSETSTASVKAGETATITVSNAVGSEQTTVLVYLGTPEDDNIIYIDQTAASEGTATFTFKVPTTAKAGTYTILAGSESTTTAGDSTIVVNAADSEDPVLPTLTSIAVADDAKVEYTVGDEFVAPTVTATYSDGSTKTVEATFEGYDMATAGTQTVTVKYEGVTTTYEITVTAPVAPTVVSLAVAADAKVEYTVGDEFVAPVVTATYSDDSTATVEATFEGYDMATAGTQTVTVKYEGVTTTYEITVAAAVEPPVPEKTLVSIAVSNAKTEYTVGDEFVAPEVIATYSDDSTATVTATFEGYDMATAGTQTVTVKYEDATTTYEITVTAPVAPTVVSLAVAADAKVEYTVGDEFVAPVVTATYSDDSTAVVTAEFAGYDMATEGTQTVTVTYEGVTTTYEITVAPAVVEPVANENVRNGKYGVSVTVADSYGFHGNYSVNVEPNTDYILAAWSKGNGSVLIRPRQNDGWGGGDNLGDLNLEGGSAWKQAAKIVTTKEGATKVVLSLVTNTYGGAGTKYIDDIYFAKASDPTVNLIANSGFEGESGWKYSSAAVRLESGVEMVNNPVYFAVTEAKTEYIVGDEFVAPTVVAYNADGTTAAVEGATFSGYDLAAEGTQRVTVTTENGKTYYYITVAPVPVDPDATLESIQVSNAKTEYQIGEEFVAPTVIATYSDGVTAEVEGATFEGFDSATAGEKTITVKYEDVTTTYTITVLDFVEWAVVATRDADDTVNFAGNAFDSRWTGQTSADKVSITGASGQGLDGTNALGFNYARSGQWGGVQTGKVPDSVVRTNIKYVSFYARIIPTDTNNEIKFTMKYAGKNCSFTANTGWQYFEYDFTEVDATAANEIQWTQDKAGTGKLVVDNLTFSNYQVAAISPLLKGLEISEPKTDYTTGDEFVAPTVTATYSDDTTATIADATIEGYDMATAGKQTVKVSYKGFTVSYDIMVTAPVKVVKSIAIADDAKVEYTVGDSFVAPAVTATYEDDTTEVVTGAAFSGYDLTAEGTQTVTVSYGGQTITYEITVAPGDLEPWAVVATRDEDDTVGFASNAFDGRWNGESSSDKISNADGSGLGLNGTNSTAFTYSRAGGWSGVQTATLPATVDLTKTTNFSFYARIIPTTEGVTSSSFNVNFSGANCKFEATTGWQFFTFDLSGSDITATTQLQFLVNTKNTGTLVMDNLTFSNYGVSPISPLLQSIEVVEPVTEFELNAEFVAPVVKAVYSDGTSAEVEATFEGYDMASNGAQTVTVKYQGFVATYDILVGQEGGPVVNNNVRNGSKSAAVTVNTSSYDFHLKYSIPLEPNTDYIMTAWSKGSGSVILAGRLNGSWGGGDAKNLNLATGDQWKFNATAFNSGAEANGRAIDSVTLCFITNGFGAKGTMYVDDVFLAKASDPTVNLIPDPGFELGAWGTDKAVAEEASEIALDVELYTLVAINSKTAYTTGDEFVAPEKVVLVKKDGTTEEVTGATVEGYDMATPGTQTVTVKYNDLVGRYLITVSDPVVEPEKTLVSIAVADDAKVEYTVGDEFVAPVVTATYSDDSTEVVTATFEGFDSATAGTKTITVKYEGVETTYEITVVEATPSLPTFTAIVDVTRDLGYADDEEPAEVYYVKSLVLSEGNGTYDVKIGDRQLYWSEERECYVGVVDVANYDAEAETLYNVSIVTVDKVTSLKYGDLDGNNRINTTDFSALKNYIELGIIPVIRPAADVTADGRINNTDLKGLATYMETEEPFFPKN